MRKSLQPVRLQLHLCVEGNDGGRHPSVADLSIYSWFISSQWNIGRNSAFGCAACLQDFSRSTLVVPPEVKVQPRRSAIQFPQPRRDAVGDHLLRVSRIGPTLPGPEPHALPLGEHLTAPVSTAAAGAVADVFRALGLGTKKRYVLDSAISAAPAFEQKGFNRVLKQLYQKPAGSPAAEPASKRSKERSQRRVEIEELIVDSLEKTEVHPVGKRKIRAAGTHR